MIISHLHKYIFIKTRKTAGTSIEIALSKYAGPRDVITPLHEKDEATRRHLGYPGPQNCRIPLKNYSLRTAYRSIRGRRPAVFFNHCSASFVKDHVDSDIWSTYFKFSVERNPWDKFISWYYWNNSTQSKQSLSEFARTPRARVASNFSLYTIKSELAVDRVFLFEELPSAMIELSRRVGLPEVPILSRAKGGHRPNKRSYRELLSEETRNIIDEMHEQEIAMFKYSF